MAKAPKPLVLSGSVTDGKLSFAADQRTKMRLALAHWPSQAVTVTVEPYEERRRVRANNFYWKALDLMARHGNEHFEQYAGWTKDDWHVAMATQYNGKVLSDLDPKTWGVTEMRVGLSTAKLSIEAFSAYLDNVLMFAARELGLFIEPTKSEDWREREAA